MLYKRVCVCKCVCVCAFEGLCVFLDVSGAPCHSKPSESSRNVDMETRKHLNADFNHRILQKTLSPQSLKGHLKAKRNLCFPNTVNIFLVKQCWIFITVLIIVNDSSNSDRPLVSPTIGSSGEKAFTVIERNSTQLVLKTVLLTSRSTLKSYLCAV